MRRGLKAKLRRISRPSHMAGRGSLSVVRGSPDPAHRQTVGLRCVRRPAVDGSGEVRRPSPSASSALCLVLVGAFTFTFCSCQPHRAVTGGKMLHFVASTQADAKKAEAGKPKKKPAPAKPKEGKTSKEKKPRPARKYPLQPNPLAGCSLCHVDVEDEYVGTTHFKESVGCKTCHGPSKGHLADENNEVKPDEVFARKNVDRLCGECHDCDRPDPTKTPKGKDEKPLVCIDCHGHHDQKLVGKAETPKKPKKKLPTNRE